MLNALLDLVHECWLRIVHYIPLDAFSIHELVLQNSALLGLRTGTCGIKRYQLVRTSEVHYRYPLHVAFVGLRI